VPHPAPARRDARLVLSLSLASLSGGLFLPLSLVYFTVLTDIPLPVLGAVVSAAVLVGLPLPLVAGVLVARWSAQPVVVLGLALQSAAYAGFVVVREPAEILLASSVMVVGGRLFWSAVFTFLADHAETQSTLSTEQWFGRLNAVRTVGIVVGGLVTGGVVSAGTQDAYVALAWAACGCSAGAAVLRDAGFLRFLGLNSVLALATLFLGLALPTVVRTTLSAPGWVTAVLLVTNALLVAVLSARGARLTVRVAKVRVVGRAALLWCAAFGVIAVAVTLPRTPAVAVLLLGVVLLSVAEVLHAPSSAALVDELAGEARGSYLAVFQYSFVAAELVGPVMFTALFDVAAALPFAVVGLCCAMVAAVLHRAGPGRRS